MRVDLRESSPGAEIVEFVLVAAQRALLRSTFCSLPDLFEVLNC